MTRRVNLFVALNIGISILVGVLVLAGFFVPDLSALLQLLSTWTTTIIVFALLLGLVNLLRVHLGRVLGGRRDWPYSLALLLSAVLVLALGLYGNWTVGDPAVQWIFQWVYQPIGSSLFALLAFFVVAAAFRALRVGPSAAWLLLAVALLVMVGAAPWSRGAPLNVLGDLEGWIMQYPALAGLRGILLGAALGAVATSLRVLLGIDRPYAS